MGKLTERGAMLLGEFLRERLFGADRPTTSVSLGRTGRKKRPGKIDASELVKAALTWGGLLFGCPRGGSNESSERPELKAVANMAPRAVAKRVLDRLGIWRQSGCFPSHA